MIPYIHIDDLRIGPLTLHPFGVLVATGVMVGVRLAQWRARDRSLDVGSLNSFITSILIGGFLAGHVLDEAFYHPAEMVRQPLSLLFVWNGLSSFGGFIGGVCGALTWKFYEWVPAFRLRPSSLGWIANRSTPAGRPRGRWRSRVGSVEILRPARRPAALSILAFCDVILSVFPVAWAFGRAGCAVAHDHPGVRTSAQSLAAVAYGPGPVHAYGWFELRYGSIPRYDLGLSEFVFALAVALIFASTWTKRLPLGSYVGALPLIYAPVRFALDYLRLDDIEGGDLRYASLTPAQWACLALFAFGLWFVSCRPAAVHA